jgi:hypothetical protein
MPRKGFTPEQTIQKLRDVEISSGSYIHPFQYLPHTGIRNKDRKI